MSDYPPPPPPPPPPGGAYGGVPQPAGAYNVGDAASYGWAKFQANAGQIIIAGLVALVGIIVFEVIGFIIRGIIVSDPSCTYGDNYSSLSCDKGSGFFISFLASMIISALFYVVYQAIGAGIIRGALDITEGRPFVVGTIFKFDNLGNVLITALLTAAIVFVGFVLCILPGIIAAFFLSFSMYFVVDKGMAPVEAINASFNFVKDNISNTIVWFLLSLVITFVGALLCGVGLIVAIPVALIGTAFTYKKLTGQPVAA